VSRAVVIVGATSGIGRALARVCAAAGRPLVIAGRDADALQRIAADCRVRYGTTTRAERFDALDFDDHADFVERAVKGCGGGVEGFVLCHGEMPDEAVARRDPHVLRQLVDVNQTATISVLERAADHLSTQARGFLCAVTSVAGVRGRPRNHVYGCTKAGVSTYLEGLRVRMARSGVSVVDVRPGVVDTAMTWGRADAPLVMAIVRTLPDPIFKRLDL